MTKAKAGNRELTQRQRSALATPSDLPASVAREISEALNALLADAFALYLKTKNSTGT